MSASAFSLSLHLSSDGFAVTQGEPVVGGLHGKDVHHFHCPRCKSWMFTRPEGVDWLVNLRPTMLDDHAWFAPYAEFWTREKLAWASTPARHSYEKVTDLAGFEPLIKAFAAEGARPAGR